MTALPNTLFLRLEGPLQAWGDPSKFVIRRTMDAPTKSGVLGLVCCALGLSRDAARARLRDFGRLRMAVRVDRPGDRWWDFHTVGAGYGILSAEGKVKRTASTHEYETLVSRREYLCDASFLVALQGDASLIDEARKAIADPKWPLYLGRKSCPPSLPVCAAPLSGDTWSNPAVYDDLGNALRAVPWRPRCETKERADRKELLCLIEWRAVDGNDIAPDTAEVWYDAPVSFDPPAHEPRLVQRVPIEARVDNRPLQYRAPSPPRPRAAYGTYKWQEVTKPARLKEDQYLCVFCKSPATTVQHVTYRRAGGDEAQDDLRSLCRLCHDAVTMIEYGENMGMDRINPEDPQWRDRIIRKRAEIVEFRSLETRRRRLSPEEVE